jgi:hypothetical protein
LDLSERKKHEDKDNYVIRSFISVVLSNIIKVIKWRRMGFRGTGSTHRGNEKWINKFDR